MRIVIQPPPRQIGATAAQAVRRRLLLALATVAPQVTTVAVRLLPGGSSAPSGCRLSLRPAAGPEFVIEHFDADPLEAVSRAAAQANRRVRRRLFTTPLPASDRS